MKTVRILFAALAVCALVVSSAAAAERTLEGTILCAKCGLKKADAKECQDVLVVKAADGTTAEYYIVKNEVAKESGEVCTTAVKARVTGTIAEKDAAGKVWLTPSKIEKAAD